MKWLGAAALVGSAIWVVGCGSESAETPGEADTNRQSYEFSTRVEVGEEVQLCKFIRMPSDGRELSISRMEHDYTPGSHHFLVFRTELTEMPEGGDVFTPCAEGGGGAGSSWMSQVRGIVYGAQSEVGEFDFPDGVGMHVSPGELMLVQAHYLNTSNMALDAKMNFHLEFVEAAEVSQEAGVLFFFNPKIHLNPNAQGSASLSCPIRSDISLAFAASHMHRRGISFHAETDDIASPAMQEGALYTTTDWEEPLPRNFGADGGLIHAGSTITYTCDFANDTANPVVAGASADTNEMCMFVGMYWPRQDQAMEWCYDGVTDGVGKLGGAETFDCLAGCRGSADADACSGACWDNACPNVAMKLTGMRDCLSTCGLTCLGGLDSAACASCAADTCPDSYAALVSAKCE